jgi:hypothetical protein
MRIELDICPQEEIHLYFELGYSGIH